MAFEEIPENNCKLSSGLASDLFVFKDENEFAGDIALLTLEVNDMDFNCYWPKAITVNLS